ncbi:hypothetical protein [Bacillus sp. EAC]|uniref:hypothetical protein n=1 Tax=Bacillus sp. EAC TaxID=1978338 RepID=UPI000B439E1F|nr:hypothetical protein [Bacillus sp. EAC]
MSEFSESYHLFSNDQKDGIELLKRSFVRGFVYPEKNNWVTIIPSGRKFHVIRRFIKNNKGVLIHLINAEDHGWSLSIYDGIKRTFHFECSWEEDIEINQDEYHRERLVELINSNPHKVKPITPLDITQIFYVSDFEELIEKNPVTQVANLLRLEHFEWISYDYVQKDYKEDPQEIKNKGILIVNNWIPF